ncbi:MAG: hypothetical protein GXO39_02525 [Thermotogae bacterium]|nr:hypothetical protein [Thermotogota bacterium]
MTDILMWLFSIVAIVGAFTVVLNPNPFYSALGLLLNFLSLGAMYMLLQSPILSLIQVVVYAGGIVVFFLFVIMLLNLRKPLQDRDVSLKGILAALLVVVLVVIGIGAFMVYPLDDFSFFYVDAKTLGHYMLTEGLLPFELSSFLILVGVVAAIAVVKLYKEERR